MERVCNKTHVDMDVEYQCMQNLFKTRAENVCFVQILLPLILNAAHRSNLV